MADLTGQPLGNYRLIRLLGEGAFAVVYLGEHIHLGTQAAIKVLHTQLTSDDIDKFRTEARTIAHLLHPNIVRVLDFGVEGKTPFLVMDYALNGTLRQRHPKGAMLPLGTIVSYVRQIADALQCAHDEKLIHRDVKPENMLLGRRHEVLLSDFGIALVAQSSRYQSMKEMAGTMTYMAPEQIQGKPRPASDQYSLGIVVYEWLSGERPFHGSFSEVVAQHLAVSPPPLREKVPTISPSVEHVVMITLEKDPQKRFGSIQAFATALMQALQAEHPMMPHPSTIELSIDKGPLPPVMRPPVPPIIPTPPQVQSFRATPAPNFPVTHVLPPLELAGKVQPAGTTLCTYRGHSRWVYDATWSPNGMYIASASHDKTVQIWDSATGRKTLIYHHSQPVRIVTWSPDGTRIASASHDRTVQVWDVSTGDTLTYRNHSDPVYTLVWSPDSTRIASASYDRTVQVWDVATGRKILTHRDHPDLVYTLVWSPDSTRIASTSSDNNVQVWDATSGKNISTYLGHYGWVYTLAWSPDNTRIASASYDRTVQIWNPATGDKTWTYRDPFDMTQTIARLPNGTPVAVVSYDQTLRVWDASAGSGIFTYRGHSDGVLGIARSPDGTRIASAGHSKIVQVWNAFTGHLIFTYRGHSDWIQALAWSPDGMRIASTSRDKRVRVWIAPQIV